MNYTCPGVYVNEVSSGVKPIAGVATAVPAIIGCTFGGTTGKAVFVSSLKEYSEEFSTPTLKDDLLGRYVKAFYQNGGSGAYIISVKAVGSGVATIMHDDEEVIRVTFAGEDEVVNSPLLFTLSDDAKTIVISQDDSSFQESVALEDSEGTAKEVQVILDDIETALNKKLAEGFSITTTITESASLVSFLTDATLVFSYEKSAPSEQDYTTALNVANEIDDITMLLFPEQQATYISEENKLTLNGTLTAAVAQCEHKDRMDRMIIIDPPVDVKVDGKTLLPTPSSYAAMYYPWVNDSKGFAIPPSAYAAAMWCKIDAKRGVWKAPAGMEASILGVQSFAATVNNATQGELNDNGVNVLRMVNGFPVIWGARTLSTTADAEWKYIPVRRTFMMVEESIKKGIQWAVFEPNSENLWQALKLNIESYLNSLWREGAFQGATSDAAYFVNCGLGTSMEQDDVNAGRVIIEVGFAPLKPAEFVIVNIQQKVGQL